MSKKLAKIVALVMALAMVFALAACGETEEPTNGSEPVDQSSEEQSTEPAEPEVNHLVYADDEGNYTRLDDEEAYDIALGGYGEYVDKALAAKTNDERFVLFAKAEAYLLDSAVFVPTTTQGGAFAITHVAPHTVPYVQWGNDDDRVFGAVISKDLITKEERADLMEQWNKALLGEGTYDPAAYLTSKGHELNTTFGTSFSTAPETLDWLATSMQSDTEITVNCVDGLVEYDNLNNLNPAIAESWDVSEDGTVYTFHLRNDVYWTTSDGTQLGAVTADDFVAGLRHMLDVQEGLEYLVDGLIVGATAYYAGGGSWDDVGYKAIDAQTLEVTLEQETPYFMTMLTYSCFMPMSKDFYESRGGVYGVEEFAAAAADTATYTYGNPNDVTSQVYCGPFLVTKLNAASEIICSANPNYYNKDKVNIETIRWVFDDGSNPTQSYQSTLDGDFISIALGEASGLLKAAQEDGNFDKYSYVSDTTSTTYFGALNINRGTFALESGAVESPKANDEAAKVSAANALSNKNFRKALQFAFDRAAQNAVRTGEELRLQNLRNMYCHPEFVKLENDFTDEDGHTFPGGTIYGDIVQYYCDQMGIGINVADSQDGWYNPEAAVEKLNAAKEELGEDVQWPVQIDVVYYSGSPVQVAQVEAYKQSIENVLGTDNVIVNIVEATTVDDYYAGGYRAPDGASGNYDMFYGSGWGPDYGDPYTYLGTFILEGGYMTKTIGING
ncbi:MAG: peptide ABC transporter substrate-binding protein [Clostridia bacterium]|nr:peptide ABC transporter substrate-binding protein [Clostridia bacterium]